MEADGNRKRLFKVALISSILLSITLLHLSIPRSSLFWHIFFQWLFYIPVALAAAYFGLRGSLLTAAAAGLGYLPHLLMAWKDPLGSLPETGAEIVVLFLISAITGVLADREHKRREQLEKTGNQLCETCRELQSTFEQLKRSDRLSAIGELTATLAHEIRNPLASIRGAVDILGKKSISDADREEFCEILKQESQRLERLLSNLLDFARKPAFAEYKAVEIGRSFDAVISLLNNLAVKSKVVIRKEVASGTPQIQCAPAQVEQVLLNLCLNAIQAMHEGGELVLAARPMETGILIQVRDQGCGIVEADFDKIFDPFFTTKPDGTGIGLSVAHRIVSMHGGRIKAEPNKDTGTVFSITMPVRHPTHGNPANDPCPKPDGQR